MSDQPHRASSQSPGLVAIVAWIIPGGGYLLLRDYGRGLTVGITILILFFGGLLIGGIRCLEVPGYDAHGNKMYSYIEVVTLRDGRRSMTPHVGIEVPTPSSDADSKTEIVNISWSAIGHPVDELRSKPWNIPQILVGPLDALCDWLAVQVSRPIDKDNPSLGYVAVRSHSRVNELGVLYTAVAGLLNLLAIIDSSHRACRSEEA